MKGDMKMEIGPKYKCLALAEVLVVIDEQKELWAEDVMASKVLRDVQEEVEKLFRREAGVG